MSDQSDWQEFLHKVDKLTAVKQRAIAAVIGALVADAASQPLHWIYNDNKMKEVLAGGVDPAFSPVSHNAFYTIETGSQSPYGDQLFVQTKCLARCRGFKSDDFGMEYYTFFGPESAYDKSKVSSSYQKGVTSSQYPVKGHWRDKVISNFIEKYESKQQKTGDPTSVDPDALVAVIPIVSHYAGKPDFMQRCTEAVEMLQTCPDAVNSALIAGKIIEKFILKADGKDDPLAMLNEAMSEWDSLASASPSALDAKMSQLVKEVVEGDLTMSAIDATKKFGKA